MKVDLILVNGKIFSVSADNTCTSGSAIAIKDGKIFAIGSDEEIIGMADARTEAIDCQGNTILPGLCDSHCHVTANANIQHACSLTDIEYGENDTPDSIIERYVERMKAFADAKPDDAVIHGVGWNNAFFSGSEDTIRQPSRKDLDGVCSDRPVVIDSYCGHHLWVNTKALELAGLNENLDAPPTGVVAREENGYPTGVFSEMAAMDLIKKGMDGYDYTVEQYKETILLYQEEWGSNYGITLIQDCLCTENAKQAFMELAKEHKLVMRVRGVHLIDAATVEADLKAMHDDKGKYDVGDLYKIETGKIFVEGTYSLLEPYEAEMIQSLGLPKGYRGGELFWTEEKLSNAIAAVNKAGFPIHLHAMGDASVKLSVDAIKKAREKTGLQQRDAIAHLMIVPESCYQRIGDMKIICAMQPRWAVYDTETVQLILPAFGMRRAMNSYPMGSLDRAGGILSFGTDFPVTLPANPFEGLQCAMTRSCFENKPDYEQYKNCTLGEPDAPYLNRISLETGIKALSYGGAYQTFLEDVTGTIEKGKSAELVILDSDIENTPVGDISKIKVTKTIFKGKIVFDAAKE